MSRVNDLARNSIVVDGDRWVAAAPIVSAASEQPHGIALAADLQPVAVMLDFVHPVGADWRLGGARRMQGGTKAVGVACANVTDGVACAMHDGRLRFVALLKRNAPVRFYSQR